MSYETRDASLKVIGASAGLVAFLVFASIMVSLWYYRGRYHGPNAIPTFGRATSFQSGPDEKFGIFVDYDAVNHDAAQHLDHYGWADRQAGVAQIPIERAIELAAHGVKPAPAAKEPGQVP